MSTAELEDCYCRYDRERIIIGNDRLERTYALGDGRLLATGLRDRALGREWIAEGEGRVAFRLPGMGEEDRFQSVQFEAGTDDRMGLSEPFLYLTMTLSYPVRTVRTTLRVHPGVPAVSTAHAVRGKPVEVDRREAPPRDFRTCRREANAMKESTVPRPDTVESLPLPGSHLRARAVRTYDVTDHYNTLARPEETLLYGPGFEKLQGNLLFLSEDAPPEGAESRAGLFVVKEAPNFMGQLNYPGCDFHTAGRSVLEVRGTGLRPEELDPERELPGYGCTVGVFDPSVENGEAALREWYNAVDRRRPERDIYILSNTWGNRSTDEKVSTHFMKAEIGRAAEIGVDVCQIDYGWQPGSLWDPASGEHRKDSRYRDHHEAFWSVHPERFPGGFEEIAEHADRKGVGLGVWFAPDDWNRFADWRADRDRLLRLYRQHRMAHFKIDIFDVGSKLGERRLARMLEGVLEGSDGAVCLQMDLTNCRRLGFFYHPHIGEIFLENRYTDWGNYYPHYTLRNLWQLSRYVPTRRLQVEFLDLSRNREKYPDDPLRPQDYPIDYAFGVAMVGSPLAWMELSELSSAQVQALKPIVTAYRRQRERLSACEVWPIGEEPTGTAWTGFQALHPDGDGYLALFREMNERPEARLELRDLGDCRLQLETCYGKGFESDGLVDPEGRLRVALPGPRCCALVRYEAR
ncbi:MAG: hypothetical protein ACOC7T_01045 [Planctomycetota bacterium]